MNTCSSPVGVFDSGIGGLTVAKEIMRQLPNEQIIYFGDTARVPYGNKSKETVTEYSLQIADFLRAKGVKCILIACNTASAVALETLQEKLDIPVIGVVEPGAKAATQATKNNRIGVIATRGTIGSGIYERLLKKTNPEVTVFGKACPLFVPLVEEGMTDHRITREVIELYLTELLGKDIDALVLGCTHYPLIRKQIMEFVGPAVTLVNPAYEATRALAHLLKEEGMEAPARPEQPKHTFYVSDGEERFRAFANSILPCEMIETRDMNVKTF